MAGAVTVNWATQQDLTWGGKQVVPVIDTEVGGSGEKILQPPFPLVLQPAPDTGHKEKKKRARGLLSLPQHLD